jgi:predicted RNA-binding protein with PIN domain
MPYLIDGHNVIAALPDINLEDDNDEAQLVLKLRTWSSRLRRKVIVIFDGGITGGSSADLSSPDVHVVFAARFHTNADRIIRERLKSLRDARNWTVISSDLEVLDQARLVGAKVLTAQQFAEQLNRPTSPVPEKPDYVSPAAVDNWLEIFPEPDTGTEHVIPESSIPKPPNHTTPPAGKPKRMHHKTPKSQENPPRKRTMLSIGEQLGKEMVPDSTLTGQPAFTDKPTDVSTEEVDAWLQVFHDPVESSIRRPAPVKKLAKPETPKKPVVRKQGDLTPEEVSAWLDIFPEPIPAPESAEVSTSPTPRRRYRQRQLDKKLAEHKAKLMNPEDTDKAALSEDDLELWQRMFGAEE